MCQAVQAVNAGASVLLRAIEDHQERALRRGKPRGGRPQHPDFGEVGMAVVVPRAGAQLDPDAILAQLKAQLANASCPSAV